MLTADQLVTAGCHLLVMAQAAHLLAEAEVFAIQSLCRSGSIVEPDGAGPSAGPDLGSAGGGGVAC